MTSQNINENSLNYYEINNDWKGRNLKNGQEIVSYHGEESQRIWLNDIPVDYSTHWHKALEMIMPVENYYDVVLNDINYHILPGQIILIPPGELHSLHAPESGKRFIFLMDISLISKMKSFIGIQSLLATPIIISKDTFPYIYEDMYQIMIQIRNEYFTNSEYAELQIQSLLLNLFVKIGENHINAEELFPNVRLYKQKEYVQKFNQVLEYIDDHYMEDISLESVADKVGFSKYHFSRLFKQYTNFTFCDYLCYRRIKAAEEFLSSPDFSITEVALQSGFPSISTFNRLFKQQKNCTPSEYRSKNRTYKKNKADQD